MADPQTTPPAPAPAVKVSGGRLVPYGRRLHNGSPLYELQFEAEMVTIEPNGRLSITCTEAHDD